MNQFDLNKLTPPLLRLLEQIAALVKEERLVEAEALMLRVKDLLLQHYKPNRPPGWG